jgi:hypothetical protein
LVERKLESQIRRRFDQLYDDLVAAEYDADDVQEILDRLEDELLDELDGFGEE